MAGSEGHDDAMRRCAEEPIHRLGRVQSHGVLLACEPDTLHIVLCSANSATLLGRTPEALIGSPLEVLGEPITALAAQAAAAPAWSDGTPTRLKAKLTLGPEARPCDVGVHRWDGRVIIECQPTSDGSFDQDPLPLVDVIAYRLGLVEDVTQLCSVACEEIQRITGYQRVLAYEFDADWNGVVIAECPRKDASPRYLGLHFPASDIPPQARALYQTVPLRVIADASDDGIPIHGEDGLSTTPDLSHALLRSVSPMHLAYLRNMGVQATIAISLPVDGRLWGLIVAHDDRPRVPPQHVVHALRVTCRVMGQLVAARLLALEHRRQTVDDRALLDLVERIAISARTSPDPVAVWHHLHDDVVAWFQADGALLVHRGAVHAGDDPGTALAADCLAALNARHPDTLFATSALHRENLVPAGSPVAGLLWIPLPEPGHALLLWRRECKQEVLWGGNPNKAMVVGTDGTALGPRRSFDQWKEVRRDHSLPWTPVHLEGAHRIAAQWHLLILEQTRRRDEATIRKLEAGILQVHEGVVIARVDPEVGLRLEFANPLFEALMHGGDAATGAIPAFLDPDVVEEPACTAIRSVLSRQEATQFEFLTRDGRWLEISLTPMTDTDGAVAHWAAILRDTTQRHHEESARSEQARELREANERYARILETSHEGIMTLNGSGRVDYCNTRMLEILALSDVPIGVPFTELVVEAGDAAEWLGQRTPANLIRRRQLDLRRPPAGSVLCDVALIPLRQEGMQRSGWLLMATDISERMALENSLLLLNANLETTIAERTAQLVSAKETADEANRSKSEFLANMSHELRSPLHGILGFTRLLIEDGDLPQATHDGYLRKVERNASNLLALVNDLLDSAKIESKSFSINIARCDLADIARHVIAEFQSDGGTHPTIRALLPPVAPCNGDSLRLSQVLRNLIANAIRFSPSGSRVQVAVERTTGGWVLAVRDRGPGIPSGELESIFERFAQSSATKTGAGGTGLGLHIARGIIRSHGGVLTASNREGGGAAFEAFLPDPTCPSR